jgi:hypothetical protein
MTAYRQRALACAAALAEGPRRLRDLKANIPDAHKILRGNVYGWFAPVERGVYTLSESGRAALLRWPQSAPLTPSIVTVPVHVLSSSASTSFPKGRNQAIWAENRTAVSRPFHHERARSFAFFGRSLVVRFGRPGLCKKVRESGAFRQINPVVSPAVRVGGAVRRDKSRRSPRLRRSEP